MRALLIAVPICLTAGTGEAEEEAAKAAAPTFTYTLERHRTSNALDEPLALDDWYSVLRGTLRREVTHELGATKFEASAEAVRFDRYHIENDTTVALATETTVRPGPATELRGTLSFRHADEGDDIPIGPLYLGTRTRVNVVAAGLQLGARLDPATTFVAELAGEREMAGDTHFQEDLLRPARLEPDRDRLRLAAGLTRAVGPFALGASGAVALLRAKAPAANPLAAFSSTIFGARARASWTGEDGTVLAAAFGIEHLAGGRGLPDATRPAYELAFLRPLPFRASLRGSIEAAFETRDTDDPLASFMRRAEIELGVPLHERLTLGLGLFDEMKDNLVLGYRDLSRGAFASLEWKANDHAALYLRIDAIRRRATPIDMRREIVDAHFGVRMNL